MSLAEKPVVTARNPFPGLRPYSTKDADFFFGREDQIHELLTRLRSERFLAVLGESGCGKSSLIRAGLLPPLIDGFMTTKGSEWRLAIMRPGVNPIDRLAQALAKPNALGLDEADPDTAMGFLQATLQGGSFGLIEAVQDANLSEGTRLLVLVDQFEELFRFSDDEDHDGLTEEDKSFIKLLIEASIHDVPIYVVITMRSEYLGPCSLCPGLPDAINRGLYLVPRPTREQLRDAIQEPVKLSNGEITQRLVNKLLNDLGNESDQLPILQHVMMRLWRDSYGVGKHDIMDLQRYQEIGGLSNALTLHIEEIFKNELSPRQKEIAEIAFRNLTEMTDKAWVIRHPAKLSYIAAAAGEDVQTVAEVLDKFRDEGRNFLMPPIPDEMHLSGNTTIDISHESLIRQWRQLRQWTREESSDRRVRKMLSNEALKWDNSGRGKEDVLAGVKLAEALEWEQRHTGEINHPNLQVEREYLEASTLRRDEKVREEEELKHAASLTRKNTQLTWAAIFIGILALIAAGAWWLTDVKRRAADEATVAATNAEKAATREKEAATDAKEAFESKMHGAHALRLAAEAEDETGRPQRRLLLALEAINQSDQEVRATNQFFDALKIFEPSGIRCQAVSGHHGAVSAISIGLDRENGSGKWLATGGADGVVFLWDLTNSDKDCLLGSEPALTLLGHTGSITALGISHDGKWLASGSADGELFYWSLETKDEFPQPQQRLLNSDTSAITQIKFSPGNNWLVSSGNQSVFRTWPLLNGLPQLPIVVTTDHFSITDIAFGSKAENEPDTQWLFSLGLDSLRMWDLSKQLPTEFAIHTDHTDWILDLDRSSLGNWLATGGDDRTVRLWKMSDLVENQNSKSLPLGPQHNSNLSRVGFSHPEFEPTGSVSYFGHPYVRLELAQRDSKWLASGDDRGAVRIWKVQASIEPPIELMKHREDAERDKQDYPAINSLAFSSDNSWFVSAASNGSVHLYRMGENGPQMVPIRLNAHEASVDEVSFFDRNVDGDLVPNLVTAGKDGIIRVWELPTHNTIVKNPVFANDDALFNNNANLLVTKGVAKDGLKVTLHDLSQFPKTRQKSLVEITTGQLHEYNNSIRELSPVAREARRQGPQSDWYTKVCVSPSNRHIVYGDHNGKVVFRTIGDESDDEIVVSRKGDFVMALALSAENEYPQWLAVVTEKQLKLFPFVRRFRKFGFDRPMEINATGDESFTGGVFSPVDRRFAAWSNKQITLIELPEQLDEAKQRQKVYDSKILLNEARTSGIEISKGAPVKVVQFGPMAKHLLVVRDNEIMLIDMANPKGKPVSLEGHEGAITAFAFDKDENWLVTGSADKTIRVWDLSQKSRPVEFKRLETHQNPIRLVSLSDDHKWLVTADNADRDGTILLWSFADVTNSNVQAFPVNFYHGCQINALAFADNSMFVVDSEGSLWRRELFRRDITELARNVVGRNFTTEEREKIWPNESFMTKADKLQPPPHFSELDRITEQIKLGDISEEEGINAIAKFYESANDPDATKKAQRVVYYDRGMTFAKSADVEEALKYFGKLPQVAPNAKQIVAGFLRKQANWLAKGGTSSLAEAKAMLRTVNELLGEPASNSLSTPAQIAADAERDLAFIAFSDGEYDDSILHFKQRIKLINDEGLEFLQAEATELIRCGDQIIDTSAGESPEQANYSVQFYGLANEIQNGVVADVQARAAEKTLELLIDSAKWMVRRGRTSDAILQFEKAQQLDKKKATSERVRAFDLEARHLSVLAAEQRIAAEMYSSEDNAFKATEYTSSAIDFFDQVNRLRDPDSIKYDPTEEAERVIVATKQRIDSERLFTEGRQAIQSGEFGKAIRFFILAKENDKLLDLDPRRLVDLLAGEEMIQKGTKLATEGQQQQAIESFDAAKERLRSSKVPDPFGRLDFDSAQLARYELVRPDRRASDYEQTLGLRAMNLAKQGKVEDAVDLLRAVQMFDPTLSFSAGTWNNLCWWSCLSEPKNAGDYLVFGEMAVQLKPEAADYRDTRGLARALAAGVEETKEIRAEEAIKELRDGAIEDFEAFVAWAWDRDDLRTQRQEWVDKLRDENEVPIDQIFTEKVIKDLKSQ